MMLAARGIFLAARRKPKLPYDAEVEYLESTGTQRIDTGVQGADGFSLAIELAVTVREAVNSTTAAYCGYGSAWNVGISLQEDFTVTKGIIAQYGKQDSAISNVKSVVGARYIAELSSSSFVLRYGSTVVTKTVSKGTTFSGDNFSIFHGSYGGGYAGMNPKGMRCYSFSLKDSNGVVVRNLVPVRFTNELGQSEGAMYDRANPTVGMNPDGSPRTDGLYRNRGTGAFTIGADKTT